MPETAEESWEGGEGEGDKLVEEWCIRREVDHSKIEKSIVRKPHTASHRRANMKGFVSLTGHVSSRAVKQQQTG